MPQEKLLVTKAEIRAHKRKFAKVLEHVRLTRLSKTELINRIFATKYKATEAQRKYYQKKRTERLAKKEESKEA